MGEKHYDNIDTLRAISCIMVIVIHVVAPTFCSAEIGTSNWMCSLIFESLSRGCVPIFFMITGYITKETVLNNYLEFYKSRFVKIVVPLIVYSFIFYVFTYAPLIKFPVAILKGHVWYHLWYMYVLLILYPFMPFIYKFFSCIDQQKSKLFLLLWFIFAFLLPTLNFLFPLFLAIPIIPEPINYFGYVFLGMYIKKYNTKNDIINISIYAVSCICIFIITYVSSINSGKYVVTYLSYNIFFVTLSAVSLFLFIDKIKMKPNVLIKEFSACSYGIYLLHPLPIYFLEQLGVRGWRLSEQLAVSSWIMLPTLLLLVTGITFLLVSLIRKNTWLRFLLSP
ncbi:acyltransferase [Desulfovibrio sp. QI0430]